MAPSFREQLAEKTASFRAPIAGESPAGPDLTYDASFDRIKAEVEKLGAMSGGAPAWPGIVDAGSEFLSSRSKDFRVAVWWAVAKLHTSGVSGLAEGLSTLHGLCTAFWETMHPPLKRARARGNLTSWLAEQVEATLGSFTPKATDKDALELVSELYNELDGLWSEKLGEAYTGMGGLRGVLRAKLAEVPSPPAATATPAAQPAATTPAQAPTNGAEAGATPAQATAPVAAPAAAAFTVANAADIPRALRALGATLRDAARELRRVDTHQAQAYRLQRVSLWLAVTGAPPAEGGKTRIAAPGVDVQRKLEALMTSEKWLELLEAAESSMGQYIYWFELHRYSALAMERLGPPFAAARELSLRELLGFIAQFPELRSLKFADGTPFASPATVSWLEEELAKSGSAGGRESAAALAVSEEDQELRARFEGARELVSRGEIAEGLALAVALAERSPDERTRFRGRLAAARLAVQGNCLDVAESLLTTLAVEVETFGLEKWEPSLAAAVYSGLLSCLGSAKTKDAARYDGLYARLCRLDPAAAIKLRAS